MISRHALVLASTSLLLSAAATAAPRPKGDAAKATTDFGYAYDPRVSSNNFVRHELGDFAGQTVIGHTPMDIHGIDFDPTGTILYALNDDPRQLGTLNLATGAFTAIGPSLPLAGHIWTGLAIDPVSGTFYASSSSGFGSALYTLAPATGAATLIGSDSSVASIIAIAMNCLGELYAHDISSDSIFRLDTSTGQGTLIGPTGVDANLPQGMDFDNESGVLYAYIYEGGSQNQYGTVNLTSGDFTLLTMNDPLGSFEGATQTTCGGMTALIFANGFESGNTSRWSSAAP